MQLHKMLSERAIEKVPNGWMKMEEFAKREGLNSRTAVGSWFRANVNEAVKLGWLEKKRFRIKAGECLRKVWHYRITKNYGK